MAVCAAHLTRIASIYTTGRGKYTISYPNDPTALALPFSTERSIGGEDVATSVWQSYPVPMLRGFTVQPRSLSMFRAEQLLSLPGSITIEGGKGEGGGGRNRQRHRARAPRRGAGGLPDSKPGREIYWGRSPSASVAVDRSLRRRPGRGPRA